MYEDIMVMFCPSCLKKMVNSNTSVEEQIKLCLRYSEENEIFKGYLILQGALITLKTEGGCPSCITLIQRVSDMLIQA